MVDLGAKIIGISDSKGGIFNSKGLDVAELSAIKSKRGSVTEYKDGEVL